MDLGCCSQRREIGTDGDLDFAQQIRQAKQVLVGRWPVMLIKREILKPCGRESSEGKEPQDPVRDTWYYCKVNAGALDDRDVGMRRRRAPRVCAPFEWLV